MSQTDLQSWLEGDEGSRGLPGYEELLRVVKDTGVDFRIWLLEAAPYVAVAGTDCTLLALRIRTEAMKRAGERRWWRWLLSTVEN